MKCQICGSTETTEILSLGHQPPADNFLAKDQLSELETYYPLDVYFCTKCFLVQLGYAVDPDLLFRHYLYNTGTNESLRRNFRQLVEIIVKRFRLTEKDLAVDIGSNDGTLLEGYLPHKVRILGVDPSSVAQMAIDKKIPTLAEFFNHATAEQIVKEHGPAKAVTATNVFAHIKDIDSVVQGVARMLAPKGVFVTESHHLLKLVKEMQYDSIYHEHLRYYSLRPLIHLFRKHGMDVFDVEEAPTHGGSIRVYACRKDEYETSPNVAAWIKSEEEAGLYNKETYEEFRKKVARAKLELQDIVRTARMQGGRIFAIGAPAKGSTLLNYCRLDTDDLACVAETSKLKIGRFTPGTHIPIVEEAMLFSEQPDYALLLSWNIKDILIPKLRAAGFKGKFIIPNPKPHIENA